MNDHYEKKSVELPTKSGSSGIVILAFHDPQCTDGRMQNLGTQGVQELFSELKVLEVGTFQ